ncbi:RNA-binding protein Raly [Columba livia]|uniref:RNA-binding protein Raly n=1 Tax=Columba livia TaxID=8932 RepID=A0A2I0M5T9_COLLI|nr:RNA-binding protein Raly [Columba livia]
MVTFVNVQTLVVGVTSALTHRQTGSAGDAWKVFPRAPLHRPRVAPAGPLAGRGCDGHGGVAGKDQILSLMVFSPVTLRVPGPRVVPVKWPQVTIPLVRRVKPTLPVKLFARSAAIANSSAKLKLESVLKCSELQTIKTELTQIKSNIDALLGRLEQIAEEQKLSTEVRKKADGSKSEISQEDTASEAEVTTEEPLNGDKGEEDGLAWDECGDELENSHYTDVEDTRLQ